MLTLPSPRGDVSELPARAPAPAPPRASRRVPTGGRRGPAPRAVPPATSCTTAACPASTRLGVGALAARAAPGARGALRGGAARARPARRAPVRGRGDGPRAARDRRGRRRRAVAVDAPRARGHARADPRVRRAPLRLPAQGGRSALVGDPAAAGAPKAALVEIQADEYGGGRPERIHAQLFAQAMDALGLDARYGAYLDVIPGVTLGTVNLMSLFGLHRRLAGRDRRPPRAVRDDLVDPQPPLRRAACAGSASTRTRDFFDEHVEADAVHEQVAAVDLAGGLVRQDPALRAGRPLGRARLLAVEAAGPRTCSARGRRARRRCASRCAAAASPPSAPLGAWKRTSLWVPSQNGRRRDLPHRHRATVSRSTSIVSPSWSRA